MNRAKLLRLSTRLANSLPSTRQLGLHSLNSTQVTHFSHLTHSPHVTLFTRPQTCHNPFNLHQYVYFSSKQQSFIDVILSNDWSKEVESELEKMSIKVTHECVVYVLMKLSKDPQKSLDFFKWVCVRKGFDPSYTPYSVLLKSLAGKGFMDKFWDIAYEIREKGLDIDTQDFHTVNGTLKKAKLPTAAMKWAEFYAGMSQMDDVVKYVVGLIKECEWGEEVEEKLEDKLEFPLSEGFVLRVVRELWKEPVRALRFFDWVGSCGGYEHNVVTYNALAKVLGQHDSVGEFWEFLRRMTSEGYELDMDSYVKIARRLGVRDDLPKKKCLGLEGTVELFEFMMDRPYKPSVQDCTFLLRNISIDSNPKLDLVYRVVDKYEAAGNTLDKSVYVAMHRALCKFGEFDEAKKIMEDMKSAGYEPDNITYSQELFGLCRQRRFEEAHKLLDQMEAEGCVPDIKTWTILIQGYCTADQVDQALSCLAKMIEKNVNPDAETLEVLLYGFLSQNKLVGAYRFLVEMVNKAHVKPWQATYKLMIEKLHEAGKLEEALDLVKMMKRHDYPPFPDPFFEQISKSGTTDDAKKFLRALSGKEEISTAAYVRVIKAFFKEGRHSEAKDLLYNSPHRVRSQKDLRKMFGSGSETNGSRQALQTELRE